MNVKQLTLIATLTAGVLPLALYVPSQTVTHKGSRKSTNSDRKLAAKPTPVSALSQGTRVSLVSVTAVGSVWSDSPELIIEAGDGEEILVVRLRIRATTQLAVNKEIKFDNPTLLLEGDGPTHTDLKSFSLFQERKGALNDVIDIPFVVPEGAVPVTFTMSDISLDLTTVSVSELNEDASPPVNAFPTPFPTPYRIPTPYPMLKPETYRIPTIRPYDPPLKLPKFEPLTIPVYPAASPSPSATPP